MAGERILYPQFRDEQSSSRYPFADATTLRSTTDANVVIPGDMFVDAALFTIGANRRPYISSIVVATQRVTIVIGDASATNRASASYDPLKPPSDGLLAVEDGYGRPAGILLSTEDNLALFSSWAVGTYAFTVAATEFVASVAGPALEPGVRAIQPATAQLMTGDIWLIGDQGVVLRRENVNTIRVDIVGVPLFKRALCEPQTSNFPAPNYLKTINGCGPDDYGNFTFTATNQEVADSVLRIYPDNGTIVIDTAGRSLV